MGADGTGDRPSIFSYPDYRVFLQNYFATRKAWDPEFSLRAFARLPELALSSSSFISAVISGRKNLSQNLRLRFGRALGLKPAELEYFELLVQCNQSKTAEERRHFQARLSRFSGPRSRMLGESHRRFYARWYFSAVWHFFGLRQDQGNPSHISKRLFPPVSPQQVEEAIRVLLELKLIKKLANGYAVVDRHLSAGPLLHGSRMRGHQEEFLGLAAANLERVPARDRHFNLLSLSVSRHGFDRIRRSMDALRAEVREAVEADEGAESDGEVRVYALALQLFPCSLGEIADGDGEARTRKTLGRRLPGTTSDAGNPEDQTLPGPKP